MEINWKDFIIALLIGIVLDVLLIYLLNGILFLSVIYQYIVISSLTALIFYFLRNRNTLLDTATISFVYGFVLSFLECLPIVLPSLLRLSALGFYVVLYVGCISGLIATVVGCIVRYVIILSESQTKSSGKG